MTWTKRSKIGGAFAVLVVAGALAGCGGDDDDSATTQDTTTTQATTTTEATTTEADCLTPKQVQQEVDRIAEGIETSSEQVQEKQQQIRDVRARECE